MLKKNDERIEILQVRVVAYCRVSTNAPEQYGSLQSQRNHFERIIKENPQWKFVELYSDVGSGLQTKNRPGYEKMVHDGKKGKFDLVLVKSLSRLGRDALTTIKQIRYWRYIKIGVYSEMERINTLLTNDYMIDIILGIAQEESRSKSNSIKFGMQQRMKSGKTILNHSQFLGYTKGEDGVLVTVPEEAEIVRKIFALYLEGNGVRKIKRYLEENGIKTVTGKREWSTSTIDRMLSNEKYIGQVIMQKTYTPDFLTGKQKQNEGEKVMYLIENAHEAIIDKETFNRVQERKRKIRDSKFRLK